MEGSVMPLYNTSSPEVSTELKSLVVGFMGALIAETPLIAAPAAPVRSTVFLRNLLRLASGSNLISFL
jgi:hypothetical protein